MTTAAEGRELTRIGPGTPMGELMRQYWIPAAQSTELVRDGAPMRLMLLGEKLIAFRDSEGRVGVMDHRCPHRCASLFLGRNEEGGIRCIYHGWKFDVAGNCVDMASVPPHQDFKHKVKAKAYPAVERAGVVWVYMGSRAEAPPLPAFEILDVPDDEISVSLIQRDCNYLQALEGEIDTSHFGYLHAGHVDPDDVAEDEPVYHTITNRAPEYHIADAALGHAVRRPTARPGRQHLLALRQLPVPVLDPGPATASSTATCMRAPGCRSTTATRMFCLPAVEARAVGQTHAAARLQGRPADRRHRPRQQAAAQHHRLAGTLAHGRQRGQRLGHGPRGAAQQRDLQRHRRHPPAGPGDHREHGPDHRPRLRAPGPSDQMITRTRRCLLLAARALREAAPCRPASKTPSVYHGARSGYFVSDDQRQWQEVYKHRLAAALHPSRSRESGRVVLPDRGRPARLMIII